MEVHDNGEEFVSKSLSLRGWAFFLSQSLAQSRRMKAFVLAGGFATRLWPLSERHAKPLLLLNGQTILAQILEKIPPEIETVILTNSKFESDFQKELSRIGRSRATIFCEDAHSEGQKLGALGAISAAAKELEIDESLLILAGDNLLPQLRIEQLFCSEDEARIAVRSVDSLDEARKFGVVEQEEGRVTAFVEKPEKPASTLVSTGFLSLGKQLLQSLHSVAKKSPDALGGIFPELLRSDVPVSVTEVEGEWFDVGSFDTYLAAHQKLQLLPLLLGQNVRQYNNRFSGKVFLGEGAVVKNCTLHEVIVYPGTRLENCVISRSVIDQDCRLAGLDLNQKLIRAGTKLSA